MVAFRTVDDLKTSLEASGLAAYVPAFVATARPTIFFVRRQVPDDPLPNRTSKMGGFPDLPGGFAWPQRPPIADAERRAAALRRSASELAKDFADQRDAIDSDTERKIAILSRPFPLAFRAQLDLATLSSEPGFDRDFPHEGLLGIFCDVADGATGHPRMFWHHGEMSGWRRAVTPEPLVTYHDTARPQTGAAWAHQMDTEQLLPVSGISVPDYWRDAFYGTALGDTIAAWYQTLPHEFDPKALCKLLGGNCTNFGDRLGGWPENIQGNPEDELSPGTRIVTPGVTPWRHIFSYGGEYFTGTRLMPPDDSGDGNTCIMMLQDDLLARRFDKAQAVYDMT